MLYAPTQDEQWTKAFAPVQAFGLHVTPLSVSVSAAAANTTMITSPDPVEDTVTPKLVILEPLVEVSETCCTSVNVAQAGAHRRSRIKNRSFISVHQEIIEAQGIG